MSDGHQAEGLPESAYTLCQRRIAPHGSARLPDVRAIAGQLDPFFTRGELE
jgi:hypothetical protein